MKMLYTTTTSKQEASNLAKMFLEKRLVACAQITNARSLYIWKDSFCDDEEYVICLKTKKKYIPKIKALLSRVHSYEVPECIVVSAKAGKTYQKWLSSVLG